MFIAFLFLTLGYVIGAISTGYFFCRYFFKVDITEHGSGNSGASNVARVLGKKYFIIIALFDVFKAYALLALGQFTIGLYYLPALFLYAMMAGLLIGNAYSMFLSFRGGKGVATALGIMFFVLVWHICGLFMTSWLLLVTVTREPFIASLVSISVVLGVLLAYGNPEQALLIGTIALWLLFRHQANIIAWIKKYKNTPIVK